MSRIINTLIPITIIGFSSCKHEVKTESPPNILLILADDMGYSDLGCFGSEIPTPNLDSLGFNGIRMTRFYNSAKCCPSRASLLTGLYPHQAGMGDMVEGRILRDGTHLPEYQGYLNDKCFTISQMLDAADYHTMMVGKWHLGDDQPHWPHSRGFQDIFTLIQGMSNYFNLEPWKRPGQDILLLEGNDTIVPDDNFYMTTSFTKKATQFLKSRPPKKPFFMYLAYTAPHFPLHALPEDINLFRGKYRVGWDKVREDRFLKMKELGILPANVELSSAFENGKLTPEWNEISDEEQRKFDLRMATHAAMIYRMDKGVGDVVNILKEQGVFDNTLIIFLSDNGASEAAYYLVNDIIADRSGEIGTAESFDSQGPSWANVSNTPLNLFKNYTSEGGIRTSFIAHWPKGLNKGDIIQQPAHVMDIMPTLLQVCKATYPADKIPLEGMSLLPLWTHTADNYSRSIGFEHMGHKAYCLDGWKAVYNNKKSLNPDKSWTLYNIDQDPGEIHDLSKQNPDKLNELIERYNQWAEHVGTYEPFDSLVLARPF